MTHNLGMASYRMPGPGLCQPDFKPPPPEASQIPAAPSNPKKRRKNANTANPPINTTPTPTPQDLLPPPLSGFGDTIVASNPFDDAPSMNPSPMSHMGGMHPGMNPHMHPHMGGGPMRGMSPMNMGMMPHMGARGGMSPMSGMAPGGMSPMNPNMSPMGGMSPLSGPNRSMGSPMSANPLGKYFLLLSLDSKVNISN